jgi:hypothetical protein
LSGKVLGIGRDRRAKGLEKGRVGAAQRTIDKVPVALPERGRRPVLDREPFEAHSRSHLGERGRLPGPPLDDALVVL